MTHEEIERCDALWQELADTARVRWMSGMLARNTVDPDHPLHRIPQLFGVPADTRVWSPVWTDPATIGCLVAMAREAWSPIDISVARQLVGSRGPWWVSCDDHNKPPTLASAETEPEALLLAIQAATA